MNHRQDRKVVSVRLALLGLLLLVGCAQYTIEQADGPHTRRLSGFLFAQSAVTSCRSGTAAAMATATASGPPDGTAAGTAAGTTQGTSLEVTGDCDRVEGGPISPAAAMTVMAAFAALVAIASVIVF